jgi:uncharacterized membrane protein
MKTENRVLMQQAWAELSGKWGAAALATLIYLAITAGLQVIKIVGPIATLIIGGPMALGYITYMLSVSRKKETDIGQIFDGFKNFGTALAAYLLMALFVFLWMLLLIVPGIIAALAYSQTFFIIADDKDISPMDAIRKSTQMMYGYKWKLFCLGLRFIGWVLLSMLTLGILLLWVYPYMYVSFAKFYDDIKDSVETGQGSPWKIF